MMVSVSGVYSWEKFNSSHRKTLEEKKCKTRFYGSINQLLTYQRYAKNKYPKNEMKSQKPLTPLPQNICLFWSPLSVGHLVKDIAEGLQLWSLATVETNWGGERTDSIDKTTG